MNSISFVGYLSDIECGLILNTDNAVGLKEEPLPSQTNGQANSGLDDVHEPSSSSGTGSLPVQSNDDGRADR